VLGGIDVVFDVQILAGVLGVVRNLVSH
jgi:hypothetical protein